MRITPEIRMLERAAEALGSLKDELVFVGGCMVGLLLSDDAAPAPRPTDDVDTLVEVLNRVGYYAVGDRLRALGFAEDMSVVCRWYGHGLKVDIMPTDPETLGFSNPWYPSAMAHSVHKTLPSGMSIKTVDAPHFLATKLEAFANRGKGDMHGSHDLEDVVAVISGRSEIVGETATSPTEVRQFVVDQLSALLQRHGVREALEGHLANSGTSPDRTLDRIRSICSNQHKY